jgi:hypothetical protein
MKRILRNTSWSSRTLVRALAFALLAAMLPALLVSQGCSNKKKEEEARLRKEREWALANLTEGKTPPPKPVPLPKELEIKVPQSVKDRYTGVVMAVGNRKTRVIKKFTMKLGETAKVPDSPYSIKIGELLPTWSMNGNVVTSRKDTPDDPAVRATIYESGKKVFDGFIFQRHKTPSFFNDTYVIGLVGVVEKH